MLYIFFIKMFHGLVKKLHFQNVASTKYTDQLGSSIWDLSVFQEFYPGKNIKPNNFSPSLTAEFFWFIAIFLKSTKSCIKAMLPSSVQVPAKAGLNYYQFIHPAALPVKFFGVVRRQHFCMDIQIGASG